MSEKDSIINSLRDSYKFIEEEIDKIKKDEKSNKVHKLQDLERLISMQCRLAKEIDYLSK